MDSFFSKIHLQGNLKKEKNSSFTQRPKGLRS